MLAKWAACPPSWKSVLVARKPEPTMPGMAFAVKLMRAAWKREPSRHAGSGPCMKPFSYLPLRSRRSNVSVAPRKRTPNAAKLRPQRSTDLPKRK